MAINYDTLAGAIGASDTQLTLTTGTGVAVGKLIRVDNEYVLIQDITFAPTVKVFRGQNGTDGVAHEILAPAVIGLHSDFPVQPFPAPEPVVSLNIDGAVPIPSVNTTFVIGKATAAALTLASASATYPVGLRLRFIASTAQAHTLTYTPGFNGDTTATDVVTFGSKVGAGFECTLGPNGLWGNPQVSTGTTIG